MKTVNVFFAILILGFGNHSSQTIDWAKYIYNNKLRFYCSSYQRIKSFDGLEKFSSLAEITIKTCKIETHFKFLFKNLTSLILDQNKINKIDESFGSCAILNDISINENMLTSLNGIENCKNLREIYFNQNLIKNIDFICKLNKLSVLTRFLKNGVF
jgi:Leucine-rich repeat (LRR) protein